MNIIKKNKQIIFAGIGLGLIFVVITFMSINRKQESALNQVNEFPTSNSGESAFSVSQRNPTVIDDSANKKEEEIKAKDLIDELSDTTPRAIFIFTNEGWSPKTKNIGDGDYVKWVNLSDRDITISELIVGQTAFKSPVTIKPNGTFDAQLKRIPPTGYWTFKEDKSGHIGRLFMYPKSTE